MAEAAILRMVASLALIVALILAAAWLARRAGWLRPAPGGAVKVLGAQSLGGRAQVAVIQVEDARLVLGVTAQHVSLLHTLPPACPEPGDALPAQPAAAGFGQALARVLNRPRA